MPPAQTGKKRWVTMAENVPGSGLDEIPQALSESRPRRRLPLIWLVPLIAVLVGGWLAVKTILAKGPTVTMTFRTAEGLEVGKTKIKFKDVDIGVLKDIRLSPDRKGVILTAEFAKDAGDLLVKDTRFWVVRPRLGAAGISGLGTLLSGAYIGTDVGKSTERSSSFVGLEVPPILTAGLPGKEFVLHADDLGSISYGTLIYFRRLQVGEVTAYQLDKDGSGVSIKVFIHAPYDRFVTTETRFWHASGIDVTLDASGIKVDTQSVASILLGGLAFEDPPHAPTGKPAPADFAFKLSANKVDAFTKEDKRVQSWVLVFNESVRGLQVGAPVDFRGIAVGIVADISLTYEPGSAVVHIPVKIRVFPDRLISRLREGRAEVKAEEVKARLDRWVAHGFRGQLRTGSLLTGQKYIAFDFFPNAPKAEIDWSKPIPEMPAIPGGLEELQATVTSIATKLDKLPYAQIASDLQTALQSLDKTLKGVDRMVDHVDVDVTPELKAALEDARRALSAADKVLASVGSAVAPDAALTVEAREALREISRAAAALRELADYLERHPEALIRGKEQKP
jgi:paraquat-inducible protein B